MRRTRPLLATAVLGLLGILPANASAADGTYDVVFCHELHRSFGGTIDSTNSFSARSLCSDPQNSSAVKIDNVDRTSEGRSAEVFWEVDEPLGITGVQVEGRLRRANGYASNLFMADSDGRVTQAVASGETGPSDFESYEWSGKPQRQFVASLECREGPSCAPSEHARTWVRNLRFTVADSSDPEVEVEGSLLGGGWLRGPGEIQVVANDQGAGLRRIEVSINGTAVEEESTTCDGELLSGVASEFAPCEPTQTLRSLPDTDVHPFVNGANVISSCASDFADNISCRTHQMRVDNEAPAANFASQDANDPELIRARVVDQFSGLADGSIFFRLGGTTDWHPLLTQKLPGELQTRVDSTAQVPGTYEFLAAATDVAGNTSQTMLRDDGSPMTLQFPLKSGVELNARLEPGGSARTLVAYGRSAGVQGRLLDAAGQPLANKPVIVDEDFGEGALIDHRIRTVTTDESGRWSSKLPAGPSRAVTVEYEGDQRYLDTSVHAGRMTVRTGAKLGLTRKHVPEGSSTTFTGRIERLGARIPARGKLVQIQYQDPTSGRWSTVRNPFRTRSDGRFKFKYGFGTHYVQDVGIRFRLKVPSEHGWPYRGTQTGARRVIVEARQ